jgi:tetratricopeptide (TPR) repeat protein
VAANGERHIWSETYERDQRDMVELLRVMARTLAREIHVELTETQQAQMIVKSPVDPAVYEEYLKGRFFWNKRTPEGFRKGIECFDRALAADPFYAPAYAGLADCYNMLGDYDVIPPGTAFTKSRAAALHAIAIDNSNAEAHASLGFAEMHHSRNWHEAEKEFELAIALNPSCSNAHHWYALCLTTQSRFDEAQSHMKEALSLDPLSLIVRTNAAWVLYFAHEYDRAVDICTEVLQLDSTFVPAHIKLGWAYEQTGRFADAQDEFQKALAISGDDPAVSLMAARAFALRGYRTEALAIIDQVTSPREKHYTSGYHVAAAYAGLHDTQRALEWLMRAHRERNGWLAWLKVDPKFDGLHGHPGFIALLDSIGFTP